MDFYKYTDDNSSSKRSCKTCYKRAVGCDIDAELCVHWQPQTCNNCKFECKVNRDNCKMWEVNNGDI